MAKEVKPNEPVENTVAAAVTTAIADVVDTAGDEPADKASKPETEKLDAQAELFVRKISDTVTKSIAELLQPTAKAEEPPEDEPKKRKPKPAPDAQPELFVRKISDAVTKSIAELLKPTAKAEEPPEDEPKKRKPKPAPTPAKKRFLTFLG